LIILLFKNHFIVADYLLSMWHQQPYPILKLMGDLTLSWLSVLSMNRWKLATILVRC